ncbi:GNAT family N-acetyltransferase [Pseudonocardia lacus]|uniref:GNAT family N-acetyltransferase n=1 Tax=Pseudonocardia lacus TaxID=2835865 RepID=UPI001BDCC106|nr:GNAT family N-acetyltransferase [Pseudonocardia lacus]
MESAQFSAGAPATIGSRALITRVDGTRWHAVEDDRVVGRGEASHRPDGRVFLSIDTWLGAVFDRLAAAMLADLAGPVRTLVDEADHDITSRWERAGLAVRRRERQYLVATDPPATGLDTAPTPSGVTILPLGDADERPLRELYEAIRAEVDAGPGWDTMPVEMPPRPAGAPLGASTYAVAAGADRYEGLARVVARRRHARIGLVAVRAGQRRRGIARALLAEVLGGLHRGGIEAATADVDASNSAATALLGGIGARHVGGVVELGRG